MSKPIIEVKEISKKFTIGQRVSDLRQTVNAFFSNKTEPELWALKDVSFTVEEGEVLGLIGPNGSGKSTLLKILSRITYPTSGKAILRGRVASLLEVGTGFHSELTGRENIYLNGSILGMKTGEIKSKFDEIVEFSGVEQFIDTPVKHYSSGMYVRLAFSVAAHLEPEILLVDEVLSVGDLAFRQKSMGKMNDVAKQGRTVIFVSHNLSAIKNLCSNGLLLSNGLCKGLGEISTIINEYIRLNEVTKVALTSKTEHEYFNVTKIDIYDSTGRETDFISSGDRIMIEMHIQSRYSLDKINLRLEFKDENNNFLFLCNNYLTGEILDLKIGLNKYTCLIPRIQLNEGLYFIDFAVAQKGVLLFNPIRIKKFEIGKSNFYKTGNLPTRDKKLLVDFSFNKLK